MTTAGQMFISDLYIARVDSKTGKARVTHHWVYDAPRFMQSQIDEERKLADQGKDFCVLSVSNKEAYDATR